MALDLEWYKEQYGNKCQVIRKLDAEIDRLRAGIQAYLDGNYGERPPTKADTCSHGQFGWQACEGCIDDHFIKLMANEGEP